MNSDSLQQINMNNNFVKTNNKMNNIIWNTIDSADDNLILSLNSKLNNVYTAKLNLINNLLYSTIPLPLNNKKDYIKLFNILAPLNNEYNLGSYKWNYKFDDNNLYIQNSITKKDYNDIFIKKYIEPLKNLLSMSKFKFEYYEFKLNRYYKNIDIVFVINFDTF